MMKPWGARGLCEACLEKPVWTLNFDSGALEVGDGKKADSLQRPHHLPIRFHPLRRLPHQADFQSQRILAPIPA